MRQILKTIYQAPDEGKSPGKRWRGSMKNETPQIPPQLDETCMKLGWLFRLFLSFHAAVRKVIYTTNFHRIQLNATYSKTETARKKRIP